MISITRTTIDGPGECVRLRNYKASGDYENRARLSRVKLLDGSSYFSHFGVSDTDRDFPIECRLTPVERESLVALFNSSALVKIAFWEGLFLGFIYRLKIRRNGEAEITLYFKEKIA